MITRTKRFLSWATPKIKKFLLELNHNAFMITLAVLTILATWKMSNSKDIQIAINEVSYQRLLFLGIFTNYIFILMRFLGGWNFRVTKFLKGNRLAFAIVLASMILGGAIVIGK